MKLLVKFLAITLFVSFMAACDDDDDNNNNNTVPNVTYMATLTAAQEVPPNTSTATGTSTLIYNPNNRTFNATTTYTGLSSAVTAGHIHKGAVGVSGPPIFPFTTLTSPIYYTSGMITTEQAADLNAGLYYVNIHSATYPEGEIRGQYVRQ